MLAEAALPFGCPPIDKIDKEGRKRRASATIKAMSGGERPDLRRDERIILAYEEMREQSRDDHDENEAPLFASFHLKWAADGATSLAAAAEALRAMAYEFEVLERRGWKLLDPVSDGHGFVAPDELGPPPGHDGPAQS